MKLVNNNISPLPFYDDLALQNHRKGYAFGQVFPLITYKNYIMPFQFIIDVPAADVNTLALTLYDFNTGEGVDLTQEFADTGLVGKDVKGYSLIEYPALFPLSATLQEGLYYIGITINGTYRYYSDVFCVKNSVDDCILLEWSNSYNLEMPNGVIDFEQFNFRCYLQTQIGRPEYNFEEEATERLGYSFIESQVSKKTYKFTFVAPEYLCDALRIVRLCDGRRITQGKEVYMPLTFSIDPKWQEQGDLAAVEAEFDAATVIANIGGYEPKYPTFDFNKDYNTDFSKVNE